MLREPKAFLAHWWTGVRVQWANPGVAISFPVVWVYDDVHTIRIGNEVSIGPFSEIVVLARSSYSSQPGHLLIGPRVVIGAHANIRAAGGEIRIDQSALLGQHVSLIAANHSISPNAPYRDLPWDDTKTGVHVQENAWIGAGATVLPGCSIGSNAIVAAGSVVTTNVPEREVWGGIPARRIRSLA